MNPKHPKREPAIVPVASAPEPAAPTAPAAPAVVELPDAAAGLYKDKSGAARSQAVTEGSGYSGTMVKLAREAAGLPPLEES